jgi:hypothetical protein
MWIGVDLDGTLATHYWPQSGPFEPTRIGQPITPMVNRIKAWLANGIEVRIVTARVSQPSHADHGAVCEAIHDWCKEVFGQKLPLTAHKDFAMVELWDDRAVRVMTDTGHQCCATPVFSDTLK